jgi:hypothetical protein
MTTRNIEWVAALALVAACGGTAIIDGDGGYGGSSSSSQSSSGAGASSSSNSNVSSSGTSVVPTQCEALCDQLAQSCTASNCLSMCSAPSPGCEIEKAEAVACALANLQPMSCNTDPICGPVNEALVSCKYGPGGATGCSIGGPPGQCDCVTEYGNDELLVVCMPSPSGIACNCMRNSQGLGKCLQQDDPAFACSILEGSCCAAIFAAEL